MQKKPQKVVSLMAKAKTKRSGAHPFDQDNLYGNYPLFVRIIFGLSGRFVNISPELVDKEINNVLKDIFDYFQVDRCGLLGITGDRGRVYISHAVYSEGIERISEDIELEQMFPWCYEKLLRGECVTFSRLSELPSEAVKDQQSWSAMGVRSALIVPLFLGAKPASFIVLNTVREERSWSQEYIPWLRMLGEICINALARRDADLSLRESQVRLDMAIEAAGAMPWTIEVGSGQIWAKDSTKEFFGFAPGSEVTIESFLKSVHPEDRERIRREIEGAVVSREERRAEYRIVRPDGSERWVLSKGKACELDSSHLVRLIGLSVDITKRKQEEEELRKSYEEISRLKDTLEAENIYLKEEIDTPHLVDNIIGVSDAIKYVHYRIAHVACLDTTVLIVGETGTGKGLVARAVHQQSLRRDRPFIYVNCAVLPGNLIESELFGREKGAFTGAQARQMGRFQLADKGTIFLDEIAELPVELQAKLLRVIESGEFEMLGDPHTIKTDVRIIASTNRLLNEEIRKGRFREDLFYRLNVFPITVPPLRDRTEDIPLLVDAIIKRLNKQWGRSISTVPREVMSALKRYSWPGNVRELENIIQRAVIMSRGPVLQLVECLDDVHSFETEVQVTNTSCLADIDRSHILNTLQALNWKIEGSDGAALALGLKPSTLRTRMQKLNIRRPETL